MSEPKKPKVDWGAIEAEYREGSAPVREIARWHGVSHTAINKRAKVDGWERDCADPDPQPTPVEELTRSHCVVGAPDDVLSIVARWMWWRLGPGGL